MGIAQHDRFGQVYVSEDEGRVEEGVKKCNFKVLQGAKFSNMKLLVISGGKGVSSFHGHEYYIGVLGHKLKSPLALGMTPELVDDSVEKAFQAHITALKDFGLADGMEEEKFEAFCKDLRKTRFHLFSVLGIAGKNWRKMDLMTKFLVFTYIDDLIESLEGAEDIQNGNLSYQKSSTLVSTLSKVLRSEDGQLADKFLESSKSSKELTRSQKCLLRSCIMLRDAAAENAKEYECSSKGFVDALTEWLEYSALESSQDWNMEVTQLMLPILAKIRHITSGGVVSLEVFLLHNGVHVDDEIRRTPLFKMITETIGSYCQQINDLYALQKVLKGKGKEWKCNEAIAFHKTKGLSEEETAEKIVDEANATLKHFDILCPLLKEIWKDDTVKLEQVEKFISVAKCLLTAYINGSAVIHRYDKDIVLDCYVKIKNEQ